MILTEHEKSVLVLAREGLQKQAIADKLQCKPKEVTDAIAEMATKWRNEYKDVVRWAGLVNYYRYEMLWSMVITALQVAPDVKLFNVALSLLDKQNRMLGIGDTNAAEWVGQPDAKFMTLEDDMRKAGIPLPRLFGIERA